MRRDVAATATLRRSRVRKAFGSIGALPRNPRTMLAYDARSRGRRSCCSRSGW